MTDITFVVIILFAVACNIIFARHITRLEEKCDDLSKWLLRIQENQINKDKIMIKRFLKAESSIELLRSQLELQEEPGGEENA